MTQKHKFSLGIVILFVFFTLVMTHPLIFKMGSSVRDLGDPLLNTWILASNVHKIAKLEGRGYFDTNIFYPHKHTLAYSEHLFTQSLIALPVTLLSDNPVFVYNVVLLFSFLTSCLGMYVLARYLTNNTLSAIIAGVIFGFSPFMFAHLSHLQIITAGGIPLAFLFLHKFIKSESMKDLLLFTLFYILQVLANGYYALYLTLFSGIYFLLFFLFKQKYKDWRFWIKAGAVLIIALVCIAPFYSQYLHVRNEMGFSRTIGSHATLKSYLSTPKMNIIYGKLTLRFWKPEGELFPGLLAFILAVSGCVLGSRRKKNENLLFEKPAPVYATILVLSFLFTFGPKGPYIILYKFVPGFDGLRAAPRFHIFVMFSLAVLAAFGFKEIAARVFPQQRKSFLLMIPLLSLILLEYVSIPIPFKTILPKDQIPEVYTWLTQRNDIQNLIELPLSKPGEAAYQVECLRLYYSIFHRKTMVNGYSGYFPPLYNELKRRWESHSLDQNIQDLEILGVDHILVHSKDYQTDDFENLLLGLQARKDRIRFVDEINGAYVFNLVSPRKKILQDQEARSILPPKGWSAEASVNSKMAANAIDGDIRTRWESGPQRKGVFFELDLGQIHSIQGVSLKLGDKPRDYPRGYRIELSSDRTSWTPVEERDLTVLPITAFLKPKELALEAQFPETETRYIRIVNTGEHDVYYWSVFEIEVFD